MSENITLRPYQEAAIAASEQGLQDGVTKQIWSLATGTGKTFSGTTYAQRRDLPTLWLVHRDELVRQAAEAFSKSWPSASIGIVKAAEDDYEAPVVVASVQSLSAKRLNRWDPNRFGTVIVDECFPAGTLVDGQPIETLGVGDTVTGFDPKTGALVPVQVTDTQYHAEQSLMQLTIHGEVIQCTRNHLFWTPMLWVEADCLKTGQTVWTANGWAEVEQTTLIRCDVPNTVFNLSVEDPYTYFVGAQRIGVHNCHHAPAISYRKILDFLHPQLLLGLTATPYRTDKASLGEVFDKIVHSYGIQEGIRDGYLVDIRAFRVEGKADLDEVHTLGGDFNQKELSHALNTPARNRLIVDAYQKHAAGTKAIAFTAGVQHAYDLAALFRTAGIPAEAVDGAMPPHDRRAVLARLKTGETRVVLNASVLTEGFDEPSVVTVILARPTKSLGLFTQEIGRGTRPSPATGKTHMILLDVVDATRRHKLMTVKDLIGLRQDPKNGTSVAERIAQESRISEDGERWLLRLNLHSENVVDLFETLTEDAAPALDWRDLLDDLTTIAEDPDRLHAAEQYYARFMQTPMAPATLPQQTRLVEFGWVPEAASALTKWEASFALDRHKKIMADWSAQRAGALAQLMGWDPQEARSAMADQLWQLTPSTSKQRAMLHKLHVPEELIVTVTKGEASRLIDTGLASRNAGRSAHA